MSEDEILTFRAGLGKWSKGTAHINITERSGIQLKLDSRTIAVEEFRGKSYTIPMKYNCTVRDAQAKIRSLRQTGYKLTAPLYPELQEHFRNGAPITAGDLFADAIESIETTDLTLTGIELLMANWNK